MSFGGVGTATVNKVKTKSFSTVKKSEAKSGTILRKKYECYRCNGNHHSDSVCIK